MYREWPINVEFCEWITCLNTHPEGLEASTLKVPNLHDKFFKKENFDADELLEL